MVVNISSFHMSSKSAFYLSVDYFHELRLLLNDFYSDYIELDQLNLSVTSRPNQKDLKIIKVNKRKRTLNVEALISNEYILKAKNVNVKGDINLESGLKCSIISTKNTYDIKDESDLILITNAALANKILKLSVVEMDGSVITNSNANCGDNDADDQLTVIATSLDL